MNARVLGSFLAVALALSAPSLAHAGFGRRGSASHGGGSSGGGSHGGGRSNVHVGSSGGGGHYQSAPSGRGWGSSRGSWAPSRPRYWGPGYHVWGYSFGYWPPLAAAPVVVDGAPPVQEAYEEDAGPRVASSLAGDLTFGGPGFLLGTQLAFEGERLGFLLGYTAAFAPIAGTPDYDTLHLAHAHLTFALLSGARGRLRLEVGPHLAVAPEVTFVAPGVGLSGVLALIGPLGLEGRVLANVWPYTQLDARAGLAFSAGAVGVSFGVRGLYLNDQGVLGRVNAGDTSDSYLGPYLNVGIAL